jgi:hypothetical protein
MNIQTTRRSLLAGSGALALGFSLTGDLLAQQPHGKCGCTGAGTPGSSTHLHHEGASV